MRLYVGNLSFDTTENDLQNAFAQFGAVSDVKIMTDQVSGRSRGFGFVTMDAIADAQSAMNSLNGTDFGGRNLTVNEARAREERPQHKASRPFSKARRF